MEKTRETVEAGDWQSTACILCYINCGIEVRVGGEDGRRFERIRGDKAHPASKGYTCQKALRLDHYQNGRGERVKVTSAEFTFVALDEAGKPRPIAAEQTSPPLTPAE